MKLKSIKCILKTIVKARRNPVAVFANMREVRLKYGISYKRYYDEKIYKRPDTWVERRARRICEKRNIADERMVDLSHTIGVPLEELKSDLSLCQKMYSGRMNAPTYIDYRMYAMTLEEKRAFINKLEKKDSLIKEYNDLLVKFFRNECSISEIEKLYEGAFVFFKNLITEPIYNRYAEALGSHNADEIYKMFTICKLTRLSQSEYIMFRINNKTIEEIVNYLPDSKHTNIIININGTEICEICNDKYKAYKILRDYYKREMINISDNKDFAIFREYGRTHSRGVFKPYNSSKGAGVQLITFNDSQLVEALFEEYGPFIIEDVIESHKQLSVLNSDSVNTVRIITYYNGKDVLIDGCLLRVGRKGSFVDNGGAGGIVVGIDISTGRLGKYGYDQAGQRYEFHPDSMVKFSGYQLPNWEGAMSLIECSARTLGKYYIGWDITCMPSCEWCVVEVNGTPQQFGKQCTSGKGALPSLINTVKMDCKVLFE